MTEHITAPFGSAAPIPPTKGENEAKTWRPLRFLAISRFLIAAVFVLLYHLERLPHPLGSSDPGLFYFTSLAYLILSLVALYPLLKRQPRFLLQLTSHILADVIIISLLMHASGGVSSGVGMLLVISVANGSMIAGGGRIPGLFAAMASIALLVEQVYTGLTNTAAETNYPLAGMLGMTLFATAILAHVLASRARESEALAHQRSVDLANMAQLTDYIIQHMQTGVMVVDPNKRVRLMNSSASRLLGTKTGNTNIPLSEYCPQLSRLLQDWEQHPGSAARPMHPEGSTLELLPQFMNIGQHRRDGVLIFIEDAATTTRQAQQLKLASLARLTASIAHEIRNPLGALSHAAALLSESPELDIHDRRLIEIISAQSKRINTVVENVLQLGRRDRTRFEEIALKPWLERFIHELKQSRPNDGDALSLRVEQPEMTVFFDPSHLHQILTNLCQNGLHHARGSVEPVKVQLYAGLTSQELGYLDIIDAGPGINEENRAHIFEPFFTTESNGTGLGLYLARELAVCNQAQLRYEPTDSGMSRFRLLFRIAKEETPKT